MDQELERKQPQGLDPERMAETYWNRMHFRSISAVVDILRQHNDVETPTVKYWQAVLRNLRARADALNKNRRPRGNA
jgi:hypothetical protein